MIILNGMFFMLCQKRYVFNEVLTNNRCTQCCMNKVLFNGNITEYF